MSDALRKRYLVFHFHILRENAGNGIEKMGNGRFRFEMLLGADEHRWIFQGLGHWDRENEEAQSFFILGPRKVFNDEFLTFTSYGTVGSGLIVQHLKHAI